MVIQNLVPTTIVWRQCDIRITIDVALVVVVDVVVVFVVVGGVLFKIELPVACRHFLLSQQPLGHTILLLFSVKSLQNGLRHRKRPLRCPKRSLIANTSSGYSNLTSSASSSSVKLSDILKRVKRESTFFSERFESVFKNLLCIKI